MTEIGRNDPCPCGSGKKYKRCHGATQEAEVAKVVREAPAGKPKVPIVPLPLWKELYEVAGEFIGLRPWEYMDDGDPVGVRDPVTDMTGYMVVMGSAGTLFGLVLYRGAAGFHAYRRVMQGDVNRGEFLSIQDCLKLELGSREDLEPEDLLIHRALGLHFKGKDAWPQFRSMVPRSAPWFLTESEARFLTLGLRALCSHARRIARGRAGDSLRDDACLVYRPSQKVADGFMGRWEPFPVEVPKPLTLVQFDDVRVRKALDARPKPDSAWNAGIVIVPASVDAGDRPYFVRGATVCQEVSGHAFTFVPGSPADSDEQLLADAIVQSVEKSGFLPDVVYVTSSTAAAALKALSSRMGFTVQTKSKLPVMETLLEELTAHMAGAKAGGRSKDGGGV